MSMADAGTLGRQYQFYHRYHTNKTNKAVHVACVPIIHLTALVLLSGVSSSLPGVGSRLDLAAVATTVMLAYYVALDKQFALLMSPYLAAVYTAATVAVRGDDGTLRYVSGILFLLGWIAQFAAHAYFEKNRPALSEDPINAVLIAPMFVVLEVIFPLGFGSTLKARLGRLRTAERARKALGAS
jgi:2-hydroxy fatty acid dioxygenase